MGARGPLRQSTLRIVPDQGVVVDAEATAASRVKPVRPDMPASVPAELAPLWDEIVGALDDAGMVARCDGPTLALALLHYAAATKAAGQLLRGPVTKVDQKNKRVMKNPASQVFRDHSTAFLAFAKELGLTFVSRARTPMTTEGAGDAGNPFAGTGTGG